MERPIALSRPMFGDEELEAVRTALDSGWVAGQGPRGKELEGRFAALCGVSSAVAVSNCTAALHLALLGFDIGTGDEVVVADYTYPATGHSVMYTGATPVFADVRPDTFTVDPESVAALIGPRTVGVIAVDVFGQCADYEELRELTNRHGVFLIEDAAAAAGATYGGRPAGSLADVACFSLHARKGVTSGEGGVFVTDDARLAELARKRSCFGVESAFDRQDADELPVPVFDMLGYNYKLSDIQAAIALVQLDRLPQMIETRRTLADCYQRLLSDTRGITLPLVGERRDHTWQSYVVILAPELDRGRVARRLREAGVQSNIGTFASHMQPVYGSRPTCPVSATLFARSLAIPMHPALSEGDIERVAKALVTAVESELG